MREGGIESNARAASGCSLAACRTFLGDAGTFDAHLANHKTASPHFSQPPFFSIPQTLFPFDPLQVFKLEEHSTAHYIALQDFNCL
jgi:hypothetical protein